MMKRSAILLFAVILFGFAVKSVSADQQTWGALNAQVIELYSQQKYSEAAEKAKKSLKDAKETFGPASMQTAQSLNNLALVYEVQEKYSDAEICYKEALPIMEKTMGVQHPHVATVLKNYIEVLKKEGKTEEAKAMEVRIEKSQESNKGK